MEMGLQHAPTPERTTVWVPKTTSMGTDLRIPDLKDRQQPSTPGCSVVLRLPYLAITGMFAFLRLLPTSSTDKDDAGSVSADCSTSTDPLHESPGQNR
ncbi:hypothetical protein JOF56_009490 [Kibdelosporangium banguiense]|uniref:Uncharacterized protein n=1 Tax=Kibdelosporangium banguiense TaxID=1365924 RepID=A0ABS4TYV2_9PSEU|nr:hypothetical protein [Kibdelosporangium banguiense]MBP2329105.1 hypothetical protein [Kibdelosporangium banguiense]